MKIKMFLLGSCLMAYAGCAVNQHAMSRSMEQTESTGAIAAEGAADSTLTQSAGVHLDSAKVYMKQKKEQETLMALEASRLEYRLAILRAEQDSLKAEDDRVENELRADVERKLLYQNILDNENKEAK